MNQRPTVAICTDTATATAIANANARIFTVQSGRYSNKIEQKDEAMPTQDRDIEGTQSIAPPRWSRVTAGTELRHV